MIPAALLPIPAAVLAETTDPEQQKTLIDNALPIAGLFVLLLLIAVYFLWRSLNKQIKKIDPDLPAGRDDKEQAFDRELTQEAAERGESRDDTQSQ
ncbi:MAG: hypothetical protein GC156_07830 [Actinomycetales bacterium]|nr:hypothetical protein [Actinomycetales bacterium]